MRAVALNLLSLATKGVPTRSGPALGVVVAALAAGSVAGEWATRLFAGWHARTVLIASAGVGAATAIIKGLLSILS